MNRPTDMRDGEREEHGRALESTLEERTRELARQKQELRLVLDNVDRGVVLIDRAGLPTAERSASFDRWFGAPEPGQTLGDILARASTDFGREFARQWEQLIDGIMPVELKLAQLPCLLATEDGRHYRLSYRTLGDDPERFEKLLVVASDVTEQVELTRRGAEQAQLLALLQHVSLGRGGFLGFFEEAEEIIARLSRSEPRDRAEVMRELHTLKSNFGLLGLELLALHVHELEDVCMESAEAPTWEDRQELVEAWQHFARRARTLLGEVSSTVHVDKRSFDRMLEALQQKRPAEEIAMLAARLAQEPVAPKLARMGERARVLAERLGKGAVRVDVEADGVVAPSHLRWLWQVLPHVVANSVDHGLDEEAERLARGKSGAGKLRIQAVEQPSAFIVEVADDGRGIDWERVRARAQRLGLPASTHEELVSALFSDGVTTREQVTEVAGRGVGLAAVQAACSQHGASIAVSSEPGQGTTFRFTIRRDSDGMPTGHAEPRRSGVA